MTFARLVAVFVAAVLLLFTDVSTAAQATTPQPLQLVLGEGNIVRVSGTQPQSALLTVTGIANASSLSGADLAALGSSLALADAGAAYGPAGAATVQFDPKPSFLGRNAAGALLWHTRMHITGVPEGTAHSRLASVTLGQQRTTYIVTYTVSNKPANAQWNLRGSGDTWSLSWTYPALYEVAVETQDEPVSNVHIVMSSLRDASGRSFGTDRLEMLETPTGPALPGVNVAANRAKTIYVRAKHGSGSPHGTYSGVIRFASDSSATPKELTLKIQASSRGMRTLGIVFTALGLAAAWYATARLRPRLARLQAMRPFTALRQAVQRFRTEVKEAAANATPLTAIEEEARQLEESLSEQVLDEEGLLPSPFAVPGDPLADTTTELKKRLTAASDKFSALTVLLRKGIVPLRQRLGETANREALLELIRELDRYAPLATGIPDATANVTDVLRRQPATAGRESGRDIAAGVTTVKEIDYLIQSTTDVAWTIWAIVSLVTGVIWIMSDVDYGVPVDLLYSFLWGFGLTAFGAGVQTLTPASVAAPLKLKLPA